MNKNNIVKNNYIEERIWRHIIDWLLCLIMPLTLIDILIFLILINMHDNNTILWITFIIIIIGLFIVLRSLLKDTEKLINNLQNHEKGRHSKMVS